jgi:hypothetical protein
MSAPSSTTPSLFEPTRFDKANRSRMFDVESEIDKLNKSVADLKALFFTGQRTAKTAGGFTDDYMIVNINGNTYKIQLLAE